MKKSILCLLLITTLSFTGFSQEFSYGLKGGINFSRGGQVTGSSSGEGYWDETLQGTGKMGFHGGAFLQVNFGKFFVRPEVEYTSAGREFDFPGRPAEHTIQKFDVPFLAGYNIWGPLDIYAGGVYSNILNSQVLDTEQPTRIVVQNTPINAQAGIKVEFGRFGLDLRYEYSLSSPEPQPRLNFNDDVFRAPGEDRGVNYVHYDDATLDLIKLSVTFKIGGPGLNERRRRACY